MEKERVEIKLDKKKAILSLLGAVAFVAVAIWMITQADKQQRFSPTSVTLVGYLGAIFFGAAGAYIFYKLFDTKPGLVIDKDGIFDNSSAIGGQLIRWETITGVRTEQIESTKFILIYIDNVDEFIGRLSGMKKMLVKANYNRYGTPVAISSTALSCNFDELLSIITERLNRSLDSKAAIG